MCVSLRAPNLKGGRTQLSDVEGVGWEKRGEKENENERKVESTRKRQAERGKGRERGWSLCCSSPSIFGCAHAPAAAGSKYGHWQGTSRRAVNNTHTATSHTEDRTKKQNVFGTNGNLTQAHIFEGRPLRMSDLLQR